jgi:putative ABC transport system permease protein
MFYESLLQDLRVGLRVLIKEKGFCALAVFVLAIGICAVTTMFSVVNGVMLRGFSFPNAKRLMSVQIIDPAQTTANGVVSQIFSADYEDLHAQQKSFDLLAAYIGFATVNLTVDGNPERLTGAYVTPDFFRALGVAPILGRDFTADDNRPGASKVALISHQLWRSNFGGSPSVLGKAVRINGKPATVIGVMPPGFAFPVTEQVWIPLFSEYPPLPRNDPRNVPPAVLGLIREGVSLDQANAEFTSLAKRLAAANPATNKKFDSAKVEPLINAFNPPIIRGQMWAMLAFGIGVLLIACVNVMNMQFARATLRAKELAIRSSLGATRFRLIRQMLTENLLLAGLGAVVGIAIAGWATDTLQAVTHNFPIPIPSYIVFDIDGRVLLFVVVATALSALVAGLVPAWMASRTSAVETLKEAGRGNTSRTINLITRGLVVLQIIVTCVLLIGSLLEAQSIVHQQRLDYGYDTTSLLSARMGLMDGDYPTAESRQLFYDRLVRELRNDPAFESASLTTRFRMSFAFAGPAAIEIEGQTYKTDKDRPKANVENVYDGYFATLGQKLIEGRDFNTDDRDTRQPVAVVNAFFARKFFPRESALGRRFRTVDSSGQIFGPWRTIVGVVADVRMIGPFNNPNVDASGFYLPFNSTLIGPVPAMAFAQQFTTVLVRPRGHVPPQTVTTELMRETKKVDSNLPLYFVETPKDGQGSFIAANRIIGVMFSLFGVIATVLASVGLYGVLSFSVNQRTQEFGIRMALGADNQRILQMVLRQAAIQLAIGLAVGLTFAFVIATLGASGMATVLIQISPRDPFTYTAVALLLSAVALVATLVPARRATRVDPMIALRAE